MKNFIIVYDRSAQAILDLKELPAEKEREARDLRFSLEMKYHRAGHDVEAVLLQAASFESLLQTHSRYFSSADSLLDASREAVGA